MTPEEIARKIVQDLEDGWCVFESFEPRDQDWARKDLEVEIAEAIKTAQETAAPELMLEVENLRQKLSAIHIASRYPDMNAKEN